MTQKDMLHKGVGLVKWRAYIWKTKKNISLGITYDELVSAGNVGLSNAIRKYSSDKGVKFTTYAITCIDNQIKKELNSHSKVMDKHLYLADTQDLNKQLNFSVVDMNEQENKILVRSAIQQLTLEEQQIIYMIYYENRTYTYVVKKINTTRDKLKIKHRNILIKLKELLEDN